MPVNRRMVMARAEATRRFDDLAKREPRWTAGLDDVSRGEIIQTIADALWFSRGFLPPKRRKQKGTAHE